MDEHRRQEDQAWAVEQLQELRARVQHYPPLTEQAGWAHEAVRAATAAYGEILLGNCPPSEELYEALRLLTDSVMSRANAAIARHGDRVPVSAGGNIDINHWMHPDQRRRESRMSYKDTQAGFDMSEARRHPEPGT